MPRDQISTLSSYWPVSMARITSGAIQYGVPTNVFAGQDMDAEPKSATDQTETIHISKQLSYCWHTSIININSCYCIVTWCSRYCVTQSVSIELAYFSRVNAGKVVAPGRTFWDWCSKYFIGQISLNKDHQWCSQKILQRTLNYFKLPH